MPSIQDLLNSHNGSHDAAEDIRQRASLAYLRVSTEDQDENAQRTDIERYAAQNAIAILKIYRDHARSASSDHENRTAFWEMVNEAKADDRVSCILVWDESRFFRDDVQATLVKADLRAHGVRVIPVKHPYNHDTIDGLLLEKLHQALAQIESMKIKERVVMGMKHNCQQRDPETGWLYKNGGRAPYGYRVERVQRGLDIRGLPKWKQLWVKDDEMEAGRPRWEWVRVILLDWYVGKHLSDKQIAHRLNELGVKPQEGGASWSYVTLHYLRQPEKLLTYAGYYIWHKHSRRNEFGQKRGRNKRPPSEWLYIENAHEPILTIEEAERIEKESLRRRKPQSGGVERRTQSSPHLLTGGLATCGRCGSNLIGHARYGGRRKRLEYYVCSLADRSGGTVCGGASLSVRLIHEGIWNFISERFPMTEAALQAATQRLNASIAKHYEQPHMECERWEKRLQETEDAKERLREAFRKGADSQWIAEESKRLRTEEEEAKQFLKTAQLKLHARPRPVTATDVRRTLEDLKTTMEYGEVEEKRKIIRGFVKNVTWHPDTKRAVVKFYTPPMSGVSVGSGGGTRTPDTRIMIPLL